MERSSTRKSVRDSLPIASPGNTWGDELYFRIPVDAEGDGLNRIVHFGELASWPPVNAFCIFFGPASASQGDAIRVASRVAVIGKIIDEASDLRQISSEAMVSIARE